ncbi:MAG: hypothetical protein A3F10_05665 [Coxiella sp. RIFCSPHIGHO2_12_FULL_42_15]|nr:MAG: hypothetical protein A3F10_05665 [Coxiella sp. RIFCSPHIGHO2_12_FULL_42_15]
MLKTSKSEITYHLAPNPKWTGIDARGNPLVGGKLYTYKKGTRIPRGTYADSLGSTPNTNPIVLDSKGQATIYWASDEDYYIELFDNHNQMIFTRDNYNATSGSSASHNTVYKKVENFCRNPQFSVSSLGEQLDLSQQTDSPIVDGWRFCKSNTNAKDKLVLRRFALGQNEVPFNPVYYAEFSCTDVGRGDEVLKCLAQDFKGVQTFAKSKIVISFYAKASSHYPLELQLNQHFGTGGSASEAVKSLVKNFDLTTTWARYTATYTVPNVNGKTIGINQDDQLTLMLCLPTNTVYSSIAISNVQLQLGNAVSDFQYQPEIKEEEFWENFPTGWLQPIYSDVLPKGWIWADDRTIGNTHSAATNRAHFDTIALYRSLWNRASDALCPVIGGRGLSADEDFYGNKPIRLPLLAGRTLTAMGRGAGLTPRTIFEAGGAEQHPLSLAEIPPHQHNFTRPSYVSIPQGQHVDRAHGTWYSESVATSTGAEYGLQGLPHNIMQPWFAVPMMIKL